MSTGRPIIYLVARREIQLRMRSRAFLLGTAAMVGLIAIGIVAATALSGPSSPAAATYQVGFTSSAAALEPVFSATAASAGTQVTVSEIADPTAGTAQVTVGTLDVLVTGLPTAPVAFVAGTIPTELESALDVAVLEARMVAAGIPPATTSSIVNGTNVVVQDVAAATLTGSNTTEVLGALAVAILLFVTLGLYGNFVAQGVVEEKATRIVEILLATIRPSQLLAGKVLGIGLVGLLQISIVAAATLVVVSLTRAVSIPALSVLAILGDIAWFLLGYLFYATAFAALAATVSRQEEVGSATAPMGFFLLGGYLMVFFVVLPHPDSPLSTVLSILPPFAPILMPVRIATGAATAGQVVLAVVLMVVGIGALSWFAGRVYANSILRVGKRVRLSEAFRRQEAARADRGDAR
jgi:ABC-2 type transport system permease protein